MPQLYEKCSRCGNTWLACDCENYHPPVLELKQGDLIITHSELKELRHYFNHNRLALYGLSQELRDKIRGVN
jgi:hypothetical protein